jgi:hypothetical protein
LSAAAMSTSPAPARVGPAPRTERAVIASAAFTWFGDQSA